MSASRRRPAVPLVGGLDALIPSASQVEPGPAKGDAPVAATGRPAAAGPKRGERPGVRGAQRATPPDTAPEDPIQPRQRRGNMAQDREVTLFVYCSREDDTTLRQLMERWNCSKSEVVRVLIRRAGRDLLGTH